MRSKHLVSIVIAATLLSVAVISCTNHSNDTTPNVSFSKDILPIFESSCAISSNCHVGSYNLNDHIDLTDSLAYHTITTQNLVNTGNPQASLLYAEVSSGDMPKSPYNPLASSQVTLILNWIQQGAKNN